MNETPPKLADALATERTRMAADRTLMGWIRTALSMIGFGFTIYKFLEPFSAKEGASGIGVLTQHSRGPWAYAAQPRVFSLLIACIQHRQYVKKLRSDQPYRPWDLGLVVAALVGLLGLAMIVSIILRAGPLG